MNSSQKFGMFLLVLITLSYVYFSFFNKEGWDLFNKNFGKNPNQNIEQNTTKTEANEGESETEKKYETKTVKIYVTDSKGNLRSVNRKCNVETEKSCFAYAVKELIAGPSKWEIQNKGLSSEIPSNTKVLSIREGSNNILIDLSGAFESGGGAESIYTRVHQLIKTAQANTKLPVYLYINGKQADVIGGEGIMIKQPLSEKSFND